MKNKKFIIIFVSVLIVVSLVVLGAYFLTDTNKQNNFNEITNIKENSNKNTKISWERNDNIVTNNNYAIEETVATTTNVNTNSLTNITLEEFVNKWIENTETNFLCYYNLENKLSEFLNADTIRKGEVFSSDKNFYIKGVLPRF